MGTQEGEKRKAMSAQRWTYAPGDFHTFAMPTHVCETDGAQHKHNMEYSSLFGCQDAR